MTIFDHLDRIDKHDERLLRGVLLVAAEKIDKSLVALRGVPQEHPDECRWCDFAREARALAQIVANHETRRQD